MKQVAVLLSVAWYMRIWKVQICTLSSIHETNSTLFATGLKEKLSLQL
jgi:hypothetical protein